MGLEVVGGKRKTILLCYECIPKKQYCYRMGGTIAEESCSKCGKLAILGEYVVSDSSRLLCSNKFKKEK